LLIRHSKYSVMLSKLHSYRPFFSAILPTGRVKRPYYVLKKFD